MSYRTTVLQLPSLPPGAKLGLQFKEGNVVHQVSPESYAAAAMLRAGDQVVMVGGDVMAGKDKLTIAVRHAAGSPI